MASNAYNKQLSILHAENEPGSFFHLSNYLLVLSRSILPFTLEAEPNKAFNKNHPYKIIFLEL